MSATPFGPCAVATVVAALGLPAAGCFSPSSQQTERSDPPHKESPEKESPEKVKLEVTDGAALATVLEGHRGKVVLVDFWATWCPPCMELFPHTVQLHRRFAERGLTVISVSLDDPDDARAAALEFLTRQGATFENFISRYGGGTKSVEAFELDGALPQMKLYDRHGNMHQSFGGESAEVDPQQLDRAVEELLGKM